MRGLFLTLAAVLMLGTVAVAQTDDADITGTQSLLGKPAPDFSLATIDGKSVKLSDQKGKVVLVDLWATWCPPCRKSLPHIQAMSIDKDLATKGLVVWAVNSHEDKGVVAKFLKASKYTFTVPMDADRAVGKAYLVEGIPTTVVVGRDGTIKAVFVGFGPDSAKAIDAAVQKALDEK